MQATGTHGLDLGRIVLDLVEHHFFARALGQVIGKGLENIFVFGRVFDRCVGEHQRSRGLEFFRVFGGVGDKVVVVIAIQGVEVAAVEESPPASPGFFAKLRAASVPPPKATRPPARRTGRRLVAICAGKWREPLRGLLASRTRDKERRTVGSE
jgi:hypothetical protein